MRATKYMKTKEEKLKYLEEKGISFWFLDEITLPEKYKLEKKSKKSKTYTTPS